MATQAGVVAQDDVTNVDGIVGPVGRKSAAWRDLGHAAKLEHLIAIRDNMERLGDAWAAESDRLRGIARDSGQPHMENTGWLVGAAVLGTTVNGLIHSFTSLAEHGHVAPPPGKRTRPDGQRVATVYPNSLLDKVYAPGFRGEVWLEPGAPERQGTSYMESDGGVCAILGAGNYEAPVDVLSKMFVENKAVVYKPNPVNDGNGAHVEQILKPLVDAGYLAVANGGADVGKALVAHKGTDEVLMTGSSATFDKIVWGSAENKNSGHKQMTKPFDAELGGAAPVIVVPGQWTDKEIDHQASQLVANKLLNGAHVCASPQVIVIDKSWPQRDKFVARVRHHLQHAPENPSYYPGAAAVQQEFKAAHDNVEELGPRSDHSLQRLFIPNAPRDAMVVKREAFCPVLAEVALDGGDATAFMNNAVRFCNEELFGSLSSSILVDPRAAKSMGSRLDDAVADLRYGAIGVNVWGASVLFFAQLPWGAHPGHTADDIQSGIGKLNNTFMLDRPQKAVLWTPFVSPVHLQTARPRDRKVAERMGRYATRPSFGRLAKLLSGAMLGL
jgi:acyl-CoA reductase-like NAD-dependent aldehyde dehydrogenase